MYISIHSALILDFYYAGPRFRCFFCFRGGIVSDKKDTLIFLNLVEYTLYMGRNVENIGRSCIGDASYWF